MVAIFLFVTFCLYIVYSWRSWLGMNSQKYELCKKAMKHPYNFLHSATITIFPEHVSFSSYLLTHRCIILYYSESLKRTITLAIGLQFMKFECWVCWMLDFHNWSSEWLWLNRLCDERIWEIQHEKLLGILVDISILILKCI